MAKILAAEGAEIEIVGEDFEQAIEKASKVLVEETQKLVMKFLREIDLAVSEDGFLVWPVYPDGDIAGWYFTVDWARLKEEAYIFCSNRAPNDGSAYDTNDLNQLKIVRDRFAELVGIFEAEISSGKPSEEILERI